MRLPSLSSVLCFRQNTHTSWPSASSLRVHQNLATLGLQKRAERVLKLGHGQVVRDDGRNVDLALANQALRLFPGVEDLAAVDSLEREALENDVLQDILDMQRLLWQANQENAAALPVLVVCDEEGCVVDFSIRRVF